VVGRNKTQRAGLCPTQRLRCDGLAEAFVKDMAHEGRPWLAGNPGCIASWLGVYPAARAAPVSANA
jgi:hypothetical protein